MDVPAEQPLFTVAGNRLQMLDTGPRRLEALLQLIDGAHRSLRVIYYIYVDDTAGAAVRQALVDAARRGVAVRVILDGLGSEPAAQNDFFAPMAEAGIDFVRFVPRWGRRYLLRNHQKLVLADGEAGAPGDSDGEGPSAIIGGFNIQDSYFGTPAQQAWQDLGLRVEGPAAARLTGYFDALFAWAARPRPPMRALRKLLADWSEPQGAARWLLGGPTRRLSPWARTVKRDMRTGRRLDLIAAYFAPNPAMQRRLVRLSRRGRARIILPSKNDHGASIWASRFTYPGLIRRGVEIYEYQPTKLHTKLFLIDDVVYIGSANFDIRSLFLNLEMMLRIEDAGFAAHVRAYVDAEVAASERITRGWIAQNHGPWRWLRQAAAYFVMAVLDYNVTRGLNFGED